MSHYPVKKAVTAILSVCFIILISLVHCKKIIPEEFDEKTYSPSATVDRACKFLSQDSAVTGGISIEIEAKAMVDLYDSTTLAHYSDIQIIRNNFNNLIQNLDNLVAESLLVVKFPLTGYTTYLVCQQQVAQKLSFFISWAPFNPANNDAYIDLDIINSDGMIIAKSGNILPETISACTDSVLVLNNRGILEEDPEIAPLIRHQFDFNLDAGTYILRIRNSEPQTVCPARDAIGRRTQGFFRMVVLT
jgi:hypothetical protein